MNRMFVRGDTHGNFDFLPHWCEENQTDAADVLVILGDAGINYYGKKKETYLKEWLSKQPITLFCIRGNHEARPQSRPKMKLVETELGTVWAEEEYPNIWYAMDGGEYNWNGKTILTIGGAYSVDKFYRIANGWNWFADEQLTAEEREEILSHIDGKHYDYIFTHTCPTHWMPTDLFLKNIDQSMVDNSMERWLVQVENSISYGHWFFGHYHADRDFTDYMTMLYNKIVEI